MTSSQPVSLDQPAASPVLTNDTVDHLPAAVSVPTYERSQLTPAVVHIGVGGFHRAHQAVYFDDLAASGNTDWGIIGVGLRSPQMGEVLEEQDHLYTVVTRSPAGDDVRVIGSVIDYLYAPEDPEAVLRTLADERTRLVTLTMTGSAYPTAPVDPDTDEQVRADVETPGTPGTAFGFVVEGLNRRREAGLPPFTVLSCDNMQHNGGTTRDAVVSTARLRDPGLATWISENVSFPSSMVDRITPETSPERRDEIAERHGIEDRWPVITEPFSQWVVEDDFCNGRPPLEQVGVELVADVRPYEVMKTRMLNGAHSALGHLAVLAGFSTTDQAMADPVVRSYVEGFLAEAADGLLAIPGTDLGEYAATLVERFSNPEVADQVSRLCRRSTTKVPSYVFPSLHLALDHDRPRAHLVLAVAAWLRYLRGEDYVGEDLHVQDAHADRLREIALAAGTDPRPLLAETDVFGSVSGDERLAVELEAALQALEAGPLEAVVALTGAPARLVA